MRIPFPRFWKFVAWLGIAAVAIILLLITAAVLILPSAWFRERVRDRMVYEIERASGGRTEIGAFRFDWTTLTAEVAPFVLHGTEPEGEDPLFRAESVRVGIKIISALKRDVDIASAHVEQPQVNILIDERGVTNFPRPKIPRTSARDPIEQLLRLKINEIVLRNGTLHYGDQRLPLDLRGQFLNASLDYDFDGPSYRGSVAMEQLTVDAGPALPMTFGFESSVVLEQNRVTVTRGHLAMKETRIDLAGSVTDFKTPRMVFDINAAGALSELGKPLRLPIPHEGNVNFRGTLTYDRESNLLMAGRATGQHLAVREGRINLQDISFAGDMRMTPSQLELRNATVHALDGVFRGAVEIRNWRTFNATGQLTGVSVKSVTRMAGFPRADFSGTLAGPAEASGSFTSMRDLRAQGRLKVSASQGGVPVSGFIDGSWNGRTETVTLLDSHLEFPNSQVSFAGALGQKVSVRLESRDLSDLLPAFAFATEEVPEQLPLRLRPGGSAIFEGAVTGALAKPDIAGRVTLTRFEAAGQAIDRVVADVDANESGVRVGSLTLGQDTLRLTGGLHIGLDDWKFTNDSALSGKLRLTNARIAKLLAAAGRKEPIEGLLQAEAALSGTAAKPDVTAQLTATDLNLYGERFQRFRARVRYEPGAVQILESVAESGPALVHFAGVYKHAPDNPSTGTLTFEVSTQNWTVQQIDYLRNNGPELQGRFRSKASGAVSIRGGQVRPESINGELVLTDLVVEQRELGDFQLIARTTGQQMSAELAGLLRGSKVIGSAEFQLTGDIPGRGSVTLSPMRIGTLQDLVMVSRRKEALPLEGIVSGTANFSGPLLKPEAMLARLELPLLRVAPSRRTMNERQRADLALRSEQPIVIEYVGKAVHVRQAHLVGKETDLTIGGSIQLDPRQAWDLKVVGNLDVGVLQNFHSDFVSSGSAVINASIRGTLSEPQFSGRTELKNASFYLSDFPNGIENANGIILFDQRRANIERLQATTGGGDLFLTGFIGFGGSELLYQMQARAERVRIRYPEGVSTTANASLTFSGTTSKSLLTGVVTVVRAGFNPQTDIAGVLASAPMPIGSPGLQNPFLRAVQLDIRVETAPNLQIHTSLTRDLQAEADLRVRGTAARPVVLGRVLVSQGEIQFFGNRYTINRGEVEFFNPLRIEPVINMDLETRVRGVLVNISFNGPLNRLNVAYRSDPPLQSTEIIALLAVGRAPGSNAVLASGSNVLNQGFVGSSTNNLLGQAVAAPISSRLQRFFGVSRLKIDPHLTGLSAVPQARLTVEQQISRDVTLTYVTNLAQANQQIMRVEWDINRNWSVVAVREENGVFGVDFFFKKRLR